MPRKIFITGTDTNVGKTFVSTQLLQSWNKQGFSTLGIKPLASGCNHQLQSEDALRLQQASSVKLDYELINPITFQQPIAPHIAAQLAHVDLSVKRLTDLCQPALTYPADICLIEGIGGWHVPLNNDETMADFVCANNFDVILVVGMRLGCLNHAILTEQSILASNVNLIGWIANPIQPEFERIKENISTLEQHLHSRRIVDCL